MLTFKDSNGSGPFLKTCAIGAVSFSAFILIPDLALAGAADDIFGTNSPFKVFINFVTGPFAYFIAIVAVVVFGALLSQGSDFSGLGRRAPMTLLAIGFVLGAVTIVDKLYGGASGAIYHSVDTNIAVKGIQHVTNK